MKAYIIQVNGILHSMHAAGQALTSCEEHGIEATIVDGYTPSKADAALAELNIKAYSPGPKLYEIKNSKPGVRGCFMSHFSLWEQCANQNENFMILEHDARIVAPVPKVDFQDILHLDAWRFEAKPDYAENAPEVEEYYEVRKGVKTSRGAYAYIIKPEAAAKLVLAAHEQGYTAADMHISDRCGVMIERIQPRCAIVSDTKSLTSDRDFNI
jgi:GR25 family glycosyltransferase involved in LPS biosynthesis|tara:strand:- start:6744 stop:7379 length:636 start_codon:yes stop_codon:yes gene_type:complete